MTRGDQIRAEQFFTGGETADAIDRTDWSATPLGDIGDWPASLKTAVQLNLQAPAPQLVWWDENLYQFHNDAAAAVFGARCAPGRPAAEVWADVWPPLARAVERLRNGLGARFEVELSLPDDSAYTFALSPIPGERSPSGVLVQIAAKEFESAPTNGRRPRHFGDWLPHEFLDRITDGFLSFDADWNFTYLNQEGAKTLGRPPAELLGKNLWAEFPELSETDFGRLYLRAAAENTPLSLEAYYEPFSGWFDARAYPSASGISVFFRNTTEQRKADEETRQSARQLRMITDALPVLISYLDEDHYYRFANQSYYEWFHKTPDEIIGKHLSEVVGQKAYENVLDKIEAVLAGRELTFESWMPYREGFLRYIHVNYIPDVDEASGRVRGFYALVRDITENKRTGDRLRESEQRLRLALDIAQTSTFEIDLVTDAVETDALGRAIYGWSPDEKLTFARVQSHFHPDDRDIVVERVESALAPEGPDEFEVEQRIVRTDGETRWIRVRGRGIFDGEGPARRAVRCIGTYIDITERKHREENARFLAEIGEDFACLDGFDEIVRAVGAKIRQHLQVTRVAFAEIAENDNRLTVIFNQFDSDVIDGRGVFDLGRFMSGEALGELRRGATLTVDDIRTDPRTADFADNFEPFAVRSQISAPYLTNGEWRFMLTVQRRQPCHWRADEIWLITELSGRIWMRLERARAEEKLRQSEAQYRNLANAMPQLVWTANPDGTVDYYNSLAEHYAGLAFDETSERWQWQPMLHEDDIAPTVAAWQQALQVGSYEFEHRVRMIDGQYRWHLSRALAVRDDAGRIVKWFGTATDIDELKRAQAERERLFESEKTARAQAELANRLKDEFLATVSHELRTPLNAILGWSTMARGANFEIKEAKRAFEVIERSARNQNQIISDILDVSRIITGKLNLEIRPVGLVSVIRTAIDTVRPALQAKNIRLATELDGADVSVNGDFNRLQQVVWNLLSNAVKFTPDGGQIVIRLAYNEKSAEITVEDSGSGIAPEFLPYVFDRFRQADAGSNRKHGGLGLGLAIVKNLVEMHGGRIAAASAGPDRGASFTVLLPLYQTLFEREVEAYEQHQAAETASLPGVEDFSAGVLSRLRILIVDDEVDSLEMVGLMLKMQGARVFTATSAAEALEKLPVMRPDLLISDIGMPGRDGYELIKTIRQRERESGGRLPAIALTAYARAEDGVRALAAGFQAHLPKPVEMQTLIETVKELRIEN